MKNDEFIIDDEQEVVVTDMGGIYEVRYSNISNNSPEPPKRYLRHLVIDDETGEILNDNAYTDNKEERRRRGRIANKNSLWRTSKTSKELIITNFESNDKMLYVTLTYDKFIDDIDEVTKHFKSFIKNLSRNYNGELKYLYVLEFGYDGSVHIHCVIYFNTPVDDTIRNTINKAWKKGYAHILQLGDEYDEILRLAIYLTVDLITDKGDKEAHEIADNFEEKVKIKNARLKYFSMYSRIIRHSNNMKKPTKTKMTYAEAIKLYGNENLISKRKHEKDINDIHLVQHYEYYRK